MSNTSCALPLHFVTWFERLVPDVNHFFMSQEELVISMQTYTWVNLFCTIDLQEIVYFLDFPCCRKYNSLNTSNCILYFLIILGLSLCWTEILYIIRISNNNYLNSICIYLRYLLEGWKFKAFITGTRNQHLRGNMYSEKFELLKDKIKSL